MKSASFHHRVSVWVGTGIFPRPIAGAARTIREKSRALAACWRGLKEGKSRWACGTMAVLKVMAGNFAGSTDATFHFEIDKALEFDAVFHRKFADEVVDEAIDGKRHRSALTDAALHHIEKHFL